MSRYGQDPYDQWLSRQEDKRYGSDNQEPEDEQETEEDEQEEEESA